MVGNMADAARAVSGRAAFIGSGAYRQAYLIGGVVYKVTYDGDGIGDCSNLDEWRFYPEMVERCPKGVAIPETSLWPVGPVPVIAMAYIEGLKVGECYCSRDDECGEDCLPPDVERSLQDAGFMDVGYGNVIYDGSVYWVVDFQS